MHRLQMVICLVYLLKVDAPQLTAGAKTLDVFEKSIGSPWPTFVNGYMLVCILLSTRTQ